MVTRLIVDYVRRSAWQAVAFGVFAMLNLRLLIATDVFGPASLVAASMTVVFCMGPLMAVQLTPRTILQLPLSRRDFWRARWVAAVALPTIALGVIKCVAFAIPNPPFALTAQNTMTPQALVLSSAYDLVHAGVMFRVMILMAATSSRSQATRRSRAETVIVSLLFLGGFLWPWMLRRALPLEFSAVSAVPALLIAAGVVHAFASYFHQPGMAPHQVRKVAAGVRKGTTPAAAAVPAGGLTAIPLLVWREARSTGGGVLGLCVMLWLIRMVDPSMSSAFSDDSSSVLGQLPFFLWVAAISFGGPTIHALRHVRTLPLATGTLESIMVGRALFGAALFWCCWALASVWFTGRALPVIISAEVILFIIGLRVLADVVEIRWQSPNWPKMPILMAVFIGGATCASLATKHHIGYLFPAYTISTIAGAVVALHRTLTRSASAYKPRRVVTPFATS